MYTIVLALDHREANAHIDALGLKRGQTRFATRAASIKGLRVAEVHELPGFARRYDRYAIDAVLRYTKGQRIQFSSPGVEAGTEPVDRRLPLEKALEVAYRYVAIKEAASGSETGAPEPSEDPAPAPKPRPRRTKAAAAKSAAPKGAPASTGSFF